MICNDCGKKLPPDAGFCGECGASFKGASERQGQENILMQMQQWLHKKVSGKTLLLSGGVLAIVFSAGMFMEIRELRRLMDSLGRLLGPGIAREIQSFIVAFSLLAVCIFVLGIAAIAFRKTADEKKMKLLRWAGCVNIVLTIAFLIYSGEFIVLICIIPIVSIWFGAGINSATHDFT